MATDCRGMSRPPRLRARLRPSGKVAPAHPYLIIPGRKLSRCAVPRTAQPCPGGMATHSMVPTFSGSALRWIRRCSSRRRRRNGPRREKKGKSRRGPLLSRPQLRVLLSYSIKSTVEILYADHVTEAGEPFRFRIRHKATAPISIQITLRTAEGSAPWYQPLTMKPAAPTTFIA